MSGNAYIEYNVGPRRDPWGTTKSRACGVEHEPSTLTNCVRLERYDQNQTNAIPEMTKHLDNRERRIF